VATRTALAGLCGTGHGKRVACRQHHGRIALPGDQNWDFDSRKGRTPAHANLTKLLLCCPRLEVLLLDGTVCLLYVASVSKQREFDVAL